MYDDDDGFVTVEECAQRMGMSEQRVLGLVARGVLRADRSGWVQPAILSGAVE